MFGRLRIGDETFPNELPMFDMTIDQQWKPLAVPLILCLIRCESYMYLCLESSLPKVLLGCVVAEKKIPESSSLSSSSRSV